MKPTPNATRRTRNRIREHNLTPTSNVPIRKIGVIPGSSPGWDGMHFTCMDLGCDWKGWLPIAELEDVDGHG